MCVCKGEKRNSVFLDYRIKTFNLYGPQSGSYEVIVHSSAPLPPNENIVDKYNTLFWYNILQKSFENNKKIYILSYLLHTFIFLDIVMCRAVLL